MYTDCKIYGPYLRKDGRQHIIAIYPDKTRKTISYPKYLMEIHLNRYLTEDETVDHIDRDFTNNQISNLKVLPRREHISLDVKRYEAQSFTCPTCSKTFELSGRKLHDAIQNRKRGKFGPFCSRSCAGKYATSIQHHGHGKSKSPLIIPRYTQNPKT